MIDLKTKQAFWAEQLPIFKEKYWIPEHLDVLEFDMNGGCFDIAEGVKTDLSEEDLFDIYHRVNSGWAMWKKAVSLMREKAQAVPNQIINEIQAWIAKESFMSYEAFDGLFVVGANEIAEFIEQLVKSESGAEG
ncbi:hypothetical protein OW684_11625 [Acinetobacter baumannii]|uniref:hypothetical protein n=1 Tax=Acinetobacter baumannii TaxID=470 RepID=UPI00233F48D9|nr:hypothetical protein [Acinetobacter baumannii]MDC4551835.1 hypothetical protein [Acinetobacter baumannii]MDC5075117.1 hypothetical protein [Acinetobacter baumannii]MDC5307613.1 hypothetical protein [Acinetobacter baumannii]MDK2107084.1 hypothetical protein [Acinetobacter baumannii]MDK2112419.1 hypothetical protein [Acinetobacter baumannii]